MENIEEDQQLDSHRNLTFVQKLPDENLTRLRRSSCLNPYKPILDLPLLKETRQLSLIDSVPKPMFNPEESPKLTSRSRRGSVRIQQYSRDEIGILDIRLKLKKMKEFSKSKPRKLKSFDPAKKWKKALTKLKPIFRLTRLTEQIQLYGSPAFDDDDSHYDSMISAQSIIIESNHRNPKLPFWMIHPKSLFKSIWSIILILPFIYTAFIIPASISFSDSYLLRWFIMDLIVNLMFCIDVVLNSLTTFYDKDDNLIVSCSITIPRYFQSWFFIDFIACLPVEIMIKSHILDSKSIEENYYQIFRLLKMLKLFKIFKDNTGEDNSISNFLQTNFMTTRLILFVMMLTFCCNFFACLWNYIIRFNGYYKSWVYDSELTEQSEVRFYIISIYWVIYTLSTIGYGNIHANNNSKLKK